MSVWKKPEELSVDDLIRFPVWEFVNQEELTHDETVMQPVCELPITRGSHKSVGTKVRLHNGFERWAVLYNLSLNNPRQTGQFLGIAFERNGEWFHLARYFDADYDTRGPAQLASFLGLDVGQVFPIRYDISDIALGVPGVVRGTIPKEPVEKLSSSELTKLALEAE